MLQLKKIKLTILGILAVASFLVWSAYFSLRSDDKLTVDFFDVGQGDASFIETPSRAQILIDGGPDNSVLAKIGRVMPFFDRRIDILIVTHPDSDHLAGMVEVVKNYDVDSILINGRDCATKICAEFDKIIKEKNIKTVVARAGQEIDFGNNIKMDIYLPVLGSVPKKDDNNFSIIFYLSYGEDSFLFTGDAEFKEETALMNAWPNLSADVLKVAHHGSKNSTSGQFLEKIKPKISTISVGAKNRYGHPTAETLGRLEKTGSEILRTDMRGNIVVESAGKGIMINSK